MNSNIKIVPATDEPGTSAEVTGPTPDNVRLGPPPRWKRCPRKGQVIGGKFIPSKTPLCTMYDDQVQEEFRFPPAMAFESVRSKKLKIGLWIDLTNTDRFYARSEVESEGAIYKKLNCRGFGQSPSPDQVASFIAICKDFVAQNPLDIIFVHCTHGFNRTGFLICSYLVEIMNWSIDAAVLEFIAARPPGIYKNDYIRELFNRYGDEEDAPQAPPLPDWCDESEPLLDENEAEATANKSGPQFDPPLREVTLVTNFKEKHRLQKKCQEIVAHRGRGFPGSQPVSMDVANVKFLLAKDYMVSWKADGIRYMMYIEDKGQVYMYDRDHNVFQVDGLRFPHRKDAPGNPQDLRDTLLDGEMVVDVINPPSDVTSKDDATPDSAANGAQDASSDPNASGVNASNAQAANGSNGTQASRPRFLIYDIIRFHGEPVGQCDLRKRFECIHKEIILTRDRAWQEGRLNKELEPFSIRQKGFENVVKGIPKFLSKEWQQGLPHEVDGLIFQPVPDPYIAGRCDGILKWKPPHLNSVDFKLKIVREKKEGCLPESVGYLYVMHMEHPFATMKITRKLLEYDGKIVECRFDKGQWLFLRERRDKSYPNAFNTAVGVCNSIKTPVTEEILRETVKQIIARENARRARHGQPPAHPTARAGPPPEKQRRVENGHTMLPPPSK